MNDEPERGVVHVYTTEQLIEFRKVPAIEKLRWLEEMRNLLERGLTPEKRAILERFRRGEI